MRILNITPKIFNSYSLNPSYENKASVEFMLDEKNYDNVKYSQIAFGSMYNVKLKKIDIDLEKNKLLKLINELLESEPVEVDREEIASRAAQQALNALHAKELRAERLESQLDMVLQDKTLNEQQRFDMISILQKEYKRLQKFKPSEPLFDKPIKKLDERIDFELLNRFKSSISSDEFNLGKVFDEYYAGLKEIRSVKDLKEKYPKIKVPLSPQEVIAKKMESTLTRDFYESFDDIFETGNDENLSQFIRDAVSRICKEHENLYKLEPEHFFNQIAPKMVAEIMLRFKSARLDNGFSSIPEFRKNKHAQLSANDIKLLDVDYDDFILSVLRKQYLEGKKPNEITYTNAKTSIPVSSLRETEYKFDKISEKIKKIISSAAMINRARRDYDNFDVNKLRACLDFYASRELGNNEIILKNIIDFDSCLFTKEDVSSLIKFLRELDKVHDGEQSVQQLYNVMREQKLHPTGTTKLNEIEKQKAAEKFKLEQQNLFKLNELRSRFDEMINILYKNNMNTLANTCSKYRPEVLDFKTVEKAEYIISTINRNLDSDGSGIYNRASLDANISRWDTYNLYKHSDSEKQLFKDAVEFSRTPDGNIDIDKAGQYIINSEIVENYPQSLEFARNKELLAKVMDKIGNDKQKAIKYLFKIDAYMDMNSMDKTYLSKITSLFDQKDSVDKVILKHIVENDYVKTDTSSMIAFSESLDKLVNATIASSAKQQILEKYKYPGCINLMIDFEDALSLFASNKYSSGIKQTGRNNNALAYKMELKLKGHDDRLFSSKNDYCFDIFSDKGLH